MEYYPIKHRELKRSELDIIIIKQRRKWNSILQIMFEIGYYDSSPKWYWSALKETLEHADEIANYIPENELGEVKYNIVWEYDEGIEMDRLENLDGIPIIECCWKLLDQLYDKIKNKNLYYARKGLVDIFYRIYKEYELKYDEKSLKD